MKDEESQEPLPLDYLPPRDDLELQNERRRQRDYGAVFAGAMVIFAVGIFILGSLQQIHMTGPRTARERMIVLVWPAASLLLLVSVTAYQYFRHGRRWFVQGVLIGIGIAALIEGACFGILMK